MKSIETFTSTNANNKLRESLNTAKKNGSSVYSNKIKNITNTEVAFAMETDADLRAFYEKINHKIKENPRLFSEEEIPEILMNAKKSGPNFEKEFIKNLEERKKIEEKYKNYCLRYEANFLNNQKWQEMRLAERKEFLKDIETVEEMLEKHLNEKKLLTKNRLKLSLKSYLENENKKSLRIQIEKIKRLFEKESFEKNIFEQNSNLKELPFPVRKMSKASEKFYMEYYCEEDFSVREKIINDWAVIIEHEEKLLEKFLRIFKDYPSDLREKIMVFKDLDFSKKDEFLKNAEIQFPAKTKSSIKKEKEEETIKTEKDPNKKEQNEQEEKEKIEKEAIEKSLDFMKTNEPEMALKVLLSFKRTHGLTPKIKFHIKTTLSYIEEIELNEEAEEKKKKRDESLEAKEEKTRIKQMIEDIFSGMALKKLIKQEKLIAKNIRGAMKNEALHKGEKDAINRAFAENKAKAKNEKEDHITEIYYENEEDYIINQEGKAEKMKKLTLNKNTKLMDENDFYTLSKDEKKLNNTLLEKSKGLNNINFFNSDGELISAQEAEKIEKEKIINLSKNLSERIIGDLKKRGLSTKIDLKEILNARLKKEISLDFSVNA